MKPLGVVVVLVATVMGATALPFLPGRYDGLPVPLSGFARGLGLASLLLAPVGLMWLLYELRRTGDRIGRGRAAFVIASLAAASIAVLAATAFAANLSGLSLAVAILAAWGIVLWRGSRRLLSWASSPRPRGIAAALALVLVPGVVAGAQFALAGPLTSLAWNRTMDGMAPLIADIERYRASNGHYPKSLFSEWMDYRPAVIGIAGCQYEPFGDVYSLAVEMPTFSFDSREYLFYNPADARVMASHDADLLLRTAAEILQYRGYHSARALDRAHWSVLSFD
jgi:hypothetical protein